VSNKNPWVYGKDNCWYGFRGFRKINGGSKIKLKFNDRKEYKDYFSRLVELEREAEKGFHLNEIKSLSGKEREKKGRAILKLKAKFIGDFVGGFLVYRFFREDMPDHQINVGDVVLVSRKHPLKDSVEATVFEKGKHFITLVLSQKLPNSRYYRIDLYVNDITFKRMLGSLEIFEKGYSLFDSEIVLGKKNLEFKEEIKNLNLLNQNLNQLSKYNTKQWYNSPYEGNR